MGRRSFTVRDITEILMHWQAGRSVRQIARSLGVDRSTVRKYVRLAASLGYQPQQTNLSAQEWAAILEHHAPALNTAPPRSAVFSEIAGYHEKIESDLQTNSASTIWQRLHDEHGLQASLRSFRRYLDTYFPEHRHKVHLTVLRDDPPPGREVQVDFAYLGLWHDPETGQMRKLWVFSMVLSYSRHMFICVVTKMDQLAWLQAHVDAFTFFGGVPNLVVIDNLKAGVVRPDLYDPQFNRGYEELAAHYGVLIDPCRAGHPKDKPRVERPMPYIRDSFFQGRTFDSLSHINQCAATWCLSVAGMRTHGTTHQRPLEVFQQVEAATLRPLPAQPFEPIIWSQAKVAPDCHVQVARSLYSIPYCYQDRPTIGQTLAVRISPHTVEFYLDHELVKTHLRAKAGQRQTDWNDYPPDKARFFQRTPDWCRTRAAQLGPAVTQVIEGLLSHHQLHYLRQCQGIIRLAEKYGSQRLNAACQRALDHDDPAYKTIRTILHDGMECASSPSSASGQATRAEAGAYLHGPTQLFNPQSLANPKEDIHGSGTSSAV
jgi:transposase